MNCTQAAHGLERSRGAFRSPRIERRRLDSYADRFPAFIFLKFFLETSRNFSLRLFPFSFFFFLPVVRRVEDEKRASRYVVEFKWTNRFLHTFASETCKTVECRVCVVKVGTLLSLYRWCIIWWIVVCVCVCFMTQWNIHLLMYTILHNAC